MPADDASGAGGGLRSRCSGARTPDLRIAAVASGVKARARSTPPSRGRGTFRKRSVDHQASGSVAADAVRPSTHYVPPTCTPPQDANALLRSRGVGGQNGGFTIAPMRSPTIRWRRRRLRRLPGRERYMLDKVIGFFEETQQIRKQSSSPDEEGFHAGSPRNVCQSSTRRCALNLPARPPPTGDRHTVVAIDLCDPSKALDDVVTRRGRKHVMTKNSGAAMALLGGLVLRVCVNCTGMAPRARARQRAVRGHPRPQLPRSRGLINVNLMGRFLPCWRRRRATSATEPPRAASVAWW